MIDYLAVYECRNFREPTGSPICYIENTPDNVAAFVASRDPKSNYALITPCDEVTAYTMGAFLDLVPDDAYRKEILPFIISMQVGSAEIPDVVYFSEEQITGEVLKNVGGKMSKKQKKKNNSTRVLMNIKTISDYSLCCFNHVELVFFLIQPPNLSVMSAESVGAKIFSMTNVLKGIDDLEILCLNSRDNFEYNKIFIKERIEKEENECVRKLLEKDLLHLDKIQIQTATARSFALVVRIKEENQAEVLPLLRRIEKLLKLQGFSVERADKEQLKELLAVYFEQNVTTDKFEDVDGERWLKDETV